VGLFAAVFGGFLLLFRIASHMSFLNETLYQVFYFLFLFLLAGSTPFVASTLLHSSDYNLLFSAPIPARSVVAAKLIDAAVTNSLQFMVLGTPAMVAAGCVLNIHALSWILMPVLIAFFVLVPALLTSLGLLVLLSILGAARLRGAVTALNAIMATLACATIVVESPHLPIRPNMDIVSSAAANVAKSSPAAHVLPSAWFVDALSAVSTENALPAAAIAALAKVVGIVIALSVLCLVLGSRLISAANLAEENSDSFAPGSGSLAQWLHLGPLGALMAKDWQYLTRDSVLLSQLGMPLILFAVPVILTIQDPSRRAYGETFYFAASIIAIVLFMQTSILSLSSIGLESRAYWIVMTSPVTAQSLLLSKLLLSTAFCSAVGVSLALLSGVLFGASLLTIVIEMALIVVSSAALSGFGVGLAAAFPRFVYENPAHRVSAWALVLGFFASTAYVVVSGLMFGLGWLVAVNLSEDYLKTIVYASVVLAYVVISALAVYWPIAFGARRIEGYQWEH
jgi:ABC-2 type transport system permease protein